MATSSEENGVISSEMEGKRIAEFICWFLGMGLVISWNTMLTINDYYYKVFPDYHPSRVLPLVHQPFVVVFMALLAYYESRLNTRARNIAGYLLFTFACLACIVLDVVTSGKGGVGPYISLCVFVCFIGVANAHVQGGMVGDLAFMLPEFMQSFFAGVAASGALTSGLRLVTKAAFNKSHDGLRKGTLLFLSIAAAINFMCVILYAVCLPKLPIIKYFRAKAAAEGSRTVNADLAAAGVHEVEVTENVDDLLTLRQLLSQNWDYCADLILIYVLTLSIFPGFLYENTGEHGLGKWYAPVLVAAYNVSDLIGVYIPLIDLLRLESRKGLLAVIIGRFIFVPAFYFTAKYANQGYMIALVGLLGLTNGCFTVCVMTAAPKGYKGPEQNALGNLLVFFLTVGVLFGAGLDWLWIIGNGKF